MLDHRWPDVPHLYRYGRFNAARLEPVLLRHTLYFPNPSQLNDPIEGRPKLVALSAQAFRRAFRVLSLSKRPDRLNLWASYADDHRGYCLEFANQGMFKDAREVEYVDEVVRVTRPAQRSSALRDRGVRGCRAGSAFGDS